jgi:SAM-dependent methyltransferase
LWHAAEPTLPSEIEPFSFLSLAMLDHLAAWVALSPGLTLVDLACGGGGPGLWLARASGAALVGIDFSPVAVNQPPVERPPLASPSDLEDRVVVTARRADPR